MRKFKLVYLLILLLVFSFGCSKSEFSNPYMTQPEILRDGQSQNDAPVIIDFRALKRTICAGGYVTLKWEIENADYAEILPLVGEISHFDGENEKRVYDIQENTDFTLTLRNEDGEVSRTVNVYVKDCLPLEPIIIEVEVCLVSGLIPNDYCEDTEIEKFEEGTEPITICEICEPLPVYVDIEICSHSELLPNDYCQDTEIKQFIKGTEPIEICETCEPVVEYIEVEICSVSNLLPSEYCEHKEIRTFIKGNEPLETCNICQPPELEAYVELDNEVWDKDNKEKWVSVSGDANCLGDVGGEVFNVIVTVKICFKDGGIDDVYTKSVSVGDMIVGQIEAWMVKWTDIKWNDLWKDHQKNKTIFEVTWED